MPLIDVPDRKTFVRLTDAFEWVRILREFDIYTVDISGRWEEGTRLTYTVTWRED